MKRSFTSTAAAQDKIVLVLYPDPVTGYPPVYARDSIPEITSYADGTTTPSPSGRDFTPGDLLGCVSGELGLRKFLEDRGHTLVVTSDKDGENCQLDQELKDAHYVISQPFYPAYITAERMANAPNLKGAITAGIGSDHVDLAAAQANNVDVSEVTFCNSISVSEHVVMMILGLVRNYMPSHQWIKDGGWNIADCVQRAYDVEGMKVGTVASGRIGLAVLRRMHPFDCELHYCDRHRLPKEVEEELNLTHWDNWEDMVQEMDVVTLNCPLHPETEHMVNEDTIKLFKKGTSSTTSIVCRWVVGLLCRCVVVHACVCCVCLLCLLCLLCSLFFTVHCYPYFFVAQVPILSTLHVVNCVIVMSLPKHLTMVNWLDTLEMSGFPNHHPLTIHGVP